MWRRQKREFGVKLLLFVVNFFFNSFIVVDSMTSRMILEVGLFVLGLRD